MLLVNISQLAGPLVLAWLIDGAIPAGDEGLMLRIAGLYLLLVLITGGLSYAQNVWLGKLGLGAVTRIKGDLFSHMLTLPVSYFDEHPVGELIARVESDAEKLRDFFSSVGVSLAGAVLFLVGMLAVMTAMNPRAAVMVAAVVPVALGLIIFLFDKLRGWYEKARRLYAKTIAVLTEFVQGNEVLRAFGRTRYAASRVEDVSREKRDIEVKAGLVEYSAMSVFDFAVGPLLAVLIVKNLAPGILSGGLTVGTLLVFLSYAQRLLEPLMAIAENARGLQQARVALGRIARILDLEPEPPGSGLPATFERAIEFRHVDFAYAGAELVLRDVSFVVHPGETVALVGPSGSGKSTTVSLLCRFYEPSAGEILVDGRPLGELDLEGWRRKIGLVLQDVYLFPGSVLENVRVYDDALSEEAVRASLEAVRAADFVGRLPHGLGSELGERGGNVSTGEKQLLSFARAVAFSPDIVVMDEATASVDVVTERRIQEGMAELLAGKTAIVVAHRLSSVLRADRILYFKDGRIVAQGRHEELLASLPDYAELVALQFPDLRAGPRTGAIL